MFLVKPPASGFQSYSYSSLKTFLYSTDDKTSKLMMKRFTIVRDTRREPQSYMEKRRGGRELGDQEEQKGVSKGERAS